MTIDLYTGLFVAALCIVLGFVVSSSVMKLWRKGIVLLGLAVIGLVSYRAVNSMAGKPKMMPKMDDRVKILGHVSDKENDRIFLWISPEFTTKPITYQMAWSEEAEERLEGLRKRYKGKPFVSDVKTDRQVQKRFGESMSDIQINDDIMRFPLKNDPRADRYKGQ
jgi:hypothetical protein